MIPAQSWSYNGVSCVAAPGVDNKGAHQPQLIDIVELEQGVPSVSHEVGFPISQIFVSTDIIELLYLLLYFIVFSEKLLIQLLTFYTLHL